MAQTIRVTRSAFLWITWLCLVTIWIATLWRNWVDNSHLPTLLAVLDVALLFVLYFAEGIELAITSLLDKEPNQLRDTSLRNLLAEIQGRVGFFFAQRQVFVVVIISVLSLTTAYDWILVPFVGKVTDPAATFWFSLVLTTLTVLWFCQVTPKRLAIMNSELFLKQSGPVWRLIKAISALGLPDPSDLLVNIVARHSNYAQGRHLLPGRAAHYDNSTHLFGFALDMLGTEIGIRPDGSGSITKRFLVLYLRGHHSRMYGTMTTRTGFVRPPTVQLKALHVLPVPERIESMSEILGQVFHETRAVAGNIVSEWLGKIEVQVADDPSSTGQEARWSIEGQPLPESLWPPAMSLPVNDSSVRQPMAALLYEVTAEVAAGGFDVSGAADQWPETVVLPCRSYSISIKAAEASTPADIDAHPETGPEAGRQKKLAVVVSGCTVTLVGPGTEMPEEAVMLTQAAVSGKGDLNVSYPLQGGCYALTWRIFDSRDPS
jgi:hypothetical protein